jgi:glycine cleavage system H protein
MSRKYSREHEWLDIEGTTATVGITEFAQEQLGDIVFIDLPEVGGEFERGGDIAVVESVKAASDVYAPLTGEVLEVNDLLADEPATVNASAEADGWFFKMSVGEVGELDDLMTAEEYQAFVESES